MLFDFSRGVREVQKEILFPKFFPLLADFGDRFEIYFHRMPSLTSGIESYFGSPLNEVVGVSHLKVSVVLL